MENMNKEKFLFQLSVSEFTELMNSILKEAMPDMIKEQMPKEEKKETPLNDTLTLQEAASLTGFKPKSIYSKVCRLEMPALTRGRPLVFSRQELTKWMQKGRPSVVEMMAAEYKKR